MADVTRWDDQIAGAGTWTGWDAPHGSPTETLWDFGISDAVGRGLRVVWSSVTRTARWADTVRRGLWR